MRFVFPLRRDLDQPTASRRTRGVKSGRTVLKGAHHGKHLAQGDRGTEPGAARRNPVTLSGCAGTRVRVRKLTLADAAVRPWEAECHVAFSRDRPLAFQVSVWVPAGRRQPGTAIAGPSRRPEAATSRSGVWLSSAAAVRGDLERTPSCSLGVNGDRLLVLKVMGWREEF